MAVDYTRASLATSKKTDIIFEVLTGSFSISGVSGYSTSTIAVPSTYNDSRYVYTTVYSMYVPCFEAYWSSDNVNFTPCSLINGSTITNNYVGCGVYLQQSPFGGVGVYANLIGFIFDPFSSTNVHSATIYYKIILYNSSPSVQQSVSSYMRMSQIVSTFQDLYFTSKYKAQAVALDAPISFTLDPVNPYTVTVSHSLGYIPRVKAWVITSLSLPFVYTVSDEYIETQPTTTNVSFVLPSNSGVSAGTVTLYYRIYSN